MRGGREGGHPAVRYSEPAGSGVQLFTGTSYQIMEMVSTPPPPPPPNHSQVTSLMFQSTKCEVFAIVVERSVAEDPPMHTDTRRKGKIFSL
jgi:hypothetical protein